MRLIIVYDNKVHKRGIGLKSDWGFSCVLETDKGAVLFDTGARGDILLNNMERLDINPRTISKIVISHEHWDHSGGLNALAPLTGDIELYRLAKKSPSENMHLISAEKPQKITEKVYTAGRLEGSVDEQSLVLKDKNGWCVLVGCSHPGVEKILDAAKLYGDVLGLVGGFHGFDNFSILEELDFICPCHCTQYKQELKNLYPTKYSEGGVGKIIEFL